MPTAHSALRAFLMALCISGILSALAALGVAWTNALAAVVAWGGAL